MNAKRAANIENMIRRNYASTIRGQGRSSSRWVRLVEIRDFLPGGRGATGETRADIDTVLISMARQPNVRLIPESDQKTLTATDRAAAVRMGGQDYHLISIDD